MSAPASLGLTCADWGWESSLLTFARFVCYAFQTHTSALAGKVESQQE